MEKKGGLKKGERWPEPSVKIYVRSPPMCGTEGIVVCMDGKKTGIAE